MPEPKKSQGTSTKEQLGQIGGLKQAERLEWLMDHLEQVPEEWLTHTRSKATGRSEKKQTELECIPCSDYGLVLKAWRRAMKWTEGLDLGLSCMLASIISTTSLGSQLWFKVIGPPSCGKTTLAEALSAAKKYVVAKSTCRGFHSGSNLDGQDNSLLKQLMNKTFITKDGDTLLKAPNLGQILSEARDIYDRVSRSSYRTKSASRDYEGLNMTWLLCGTSSLRSIDSSELGERFLDCVVMDGIDDELEDAVLEMVAERADRDVGIESDGEVTKRYNPELLEAYQLTGGYVNYLRENSQALINNVNLSKEVKRKCARLGKFVAFLRARPSTHQDEDAEREFAARLVEQHVRLAKCLPAVMGKREADEDVMDRVNKIAMFTARGISLDIVHDLYKGGEEGRTPHRLEMQTNQTIGKVRNILKFLRRIDAVQSFQHNLKTSSGQTVKRVRWKLTPIMWKLYRDVFNLKD